MFRATALLSLVVGVGLLTPAFAAPPPPKGPEGIWLGTLDAGVAKLRIAFHVARKPDGSLTATVDSLDQAANGIPVEQTTLEGQTLKLALPKLGARFEGKLDGDRLVGIWTQAQPLPLELKRVDKLETTKRSQEPKRPFPYREQEVSILVLAAPRDPARKNERISLGGTLTLPPGKGPFPAVVFVTGSGSQDRDETIFEHKPFLLLSDALTRRGVATLRLDDRGVGKSGGNAKDATTLDFAEDIRSAVEWLATIAEIDKRAVGIIGHSEGGLIAPMVASKSDRVRFIIMLAGTGMTGEQLMYEQSTLIARAEKVPEDVIKRVRVDSEKLYKAMAKAKNDADIEAAANAFIAAGDGREKAAREGARPMLYSPWLRTFLTLDPVPYLEKVRVPVLAISGSNDLQVSKANMPLIEAALKRGKNADVTARVLPGLNHLFQHTETGSPSEYGKIEETFAPEATKVICDWTAEHAAKLQR